MLTAGLMERLDWDNPLHRREFCRQWLNTPRQDAESGAVPAPSGYRPCPCPPAGRHVLEPGHMFTSEGRCWVPDVR